MTDGLTIFSVLQGVYLAGALIVLAAIAVKVVKYLMAVII